MDEHATRPAAPAVVESFVKQLYITAKAVRLYPAASSIPRERAAALKAVLTAAQQRLAEVRLHFTSAGIYWEDTVVFPGKHAYVEFGREFYARSVDQVRFHVGATEQELTDLLSVLLVTPAELAQSGGFEAKLWDLGVSGLTVTEITARVIDAGSQLDALAAEAMGVLPDASELDAMLSGSGGKRSENERVLLRVAADTALVASYLSYSGGEGEPGPPDALAAARLAALAGVARTGPEAGRGDIMRSLAAAIMSLTPGLRSTVVADRVIAQAHVDPALAGVIGSLSADEIARAVIEGENRAVDPAGPEKAYLSRVVRTLLKLGIHDDVAVDDAFARALLRKGMDPDAITAVLQEASGEAIPVATAADRGEAHASRNVSTSVLTEQRLAALQEEARVGITDGDVFGTLVSLAVYERHPTRFDGTVALLEDGIGILVQGHHFETALEAVDLLERAAVDESRAPEQRARFEALLDAMMPRESIGSVASAMRLYPPESSQHEACRSLLDHFAGRAIDSMLDAMAEEQDMVARKALVDALSENASSYVEPLSRRLADPRWYVVRNVVTMLGATHDPETLSALARAVRYPDARVRREAIRALGGIQDERASRLLVGALDDGDSANVQLAVRFLGSRRYLPALPALSAVALGDGIGSRDVGPRAEAIEALGRLGSPDSLPVLASLRRFRGLRAFRRNRELVPAADRAIAAIKGRSVLVAGGEGGGSA